MLTNEQQLLRKQGVGASEVGILAGCGFKSPLELYFEKISDTPPKDLSESEVIYWGCALEDDIATRYAQINNVELKTSDTLSHPTHNRILATPDRLIVGQSKGLEIKTVGKHALKNWYDENNEITVPINYALQCYQNMLVTGCQSWDLSALFLGQEMRVYTFEADIEIFNYIIDLINRFWNEHVAILVPPPVNFAADNALDLIKQKFNKVEDSTINIEDIEPINQWLAAREKAKEYQDVADKMQAIILEMMQNNSKGILSDGRQLKRTLVKVAAREQKEFEYIKLSISKGKKDGQN